MVVLVATMWLFLSHLGLSCVILVELSNLSIQIAFEAAQGNAVHNCKENNATGDNSCNFTNFPSLMLQEFNFVILMLHVLHEVQRIAWVIQFPNLLREFGVQLLFRLRHSLGLPRLARHLDHFSIHFHSNLKINYNFN